MSQTSVLYGLSVRTCDLVAAGRAYARYEPVGRATELISLRRQQGTLQASGCMTDVLNRVPEEVWGLIRQASRVWAVKEARIELLEEVTCKDSVNMFWSPPQPQLNTSSTNVTENEQAKNMFQGDKWSLSMSAAEWDVKQVQASHALDSNWFDYAPPCYHSTSCKFKRYCTTQLPDKVGTSLHHSGPTSAAADAQCDSSFQSVGSLLSHYGLYQPRQTIHHDYFQLKDASDVSVIALFRPAIATPTLQSERIHSSTQHQSSVSFDKAFFSLPPNADIGFDHLSYDFDVNPLEALPGHTSVGHDQASTVGLGDGAKPRFFMVRSLTAA